MRGAGMQQHQQHSLFDIIQSKDTLVNCVESPIFTFKKMDITTSQHTLNTTNTNTGVGGLAGGLASGIRRVSLLSSTTSSISSSSSTSSSSSASATSNSKRVLRKMSAASNTVVLATQDCSILRWNLDSGSDVFEDIEVLPSKRPEDAIEHVYLDPTGHHCLICLKNGDNYYLHSRSTRPKKLSRLQGAVECIAFDRQSGTETVTKSFLVGTSSGFIYEISLESGGKEKTCQLVHQLDQPIAITSLYFEVIGGGSVGNTDEASAPASSKLFVMCATSTPTRLYHFLGGPTFKDMFADYVSKGSSSFTELPGEIDRAELHCFGKSSNQSRAQMFALMTKMGIYHGSLYFTSSHSQQNGSLSDNVVFEAQLMPYSHTSLTLSQPGDGSTGVGDLILTATVPLSIASTEFHYLVLTHDRLQALSRLSGSIEQDDDVLRGVEGTPLGLHRDVSKGTLWIFTDCAVYQIVCINESRRVWLIYLEKGLAGEERLFDTSLEFCQRKEEKEYVYRAMAEYHLSLGKVEIAARCFAKANAPIDEVTLRLLQATSSSPPLTDSLSASLVDTTSTSIARIAIPAIPNTGKLNLSDGPQLQAVRVYLQEQLAILPMTSKSQRTMLCTWLTEIFLHQITAQTFANQKDQPHDTLKGLNAQFKDFLRANRSFLDQTTTLTLLGSRGTQTHRHLALFFAQIVGNYDLVISQYVSDGRIADAIALLVEAPFEKVEAIIYKVAPVLIETEPEATVAMFLAHPHIKPSGLLPSLLRYSSLVDQYATENKSAGRMSPLEIDYEGNKVNFAIKYLQSCVERAEASGGICERIVTHTLLLFLLKYDDLTENGLLLFLQPLCDRILEGAQEGVPVDIGLDLDHLLRQCRRYHRKKSLVFALMMANLESEAVTQALSIDVSLAKHLANKPFSEEKRKKLWLIIALHVISTDHNPDNALSLINESDRVLRIEDLLPHLPDFTEIDLFKEEICGTLESYGSRIDHLKNEMSELSESAESIVKELDGMQKRGYSLSSTQRCESCSENLFSHQFYLFPCSHGFHAHCLLRKANEYLDAKTLSIVRGLEEQLRKLSAKTKAKDGTDKRLASQYELLQSEFDGCVAADCPLCGYAMIRSLETPLISLLETDEIKSWTL